MNKSEAIKLLGGTVSSAASVVGITPQAVSSWPDLLPQRLIDRVQAALWRLEHERDRKKNKLPRAA